MQLVDTKSSLYLAGLCMGEILGPEILNLHDPYIQCIELLHYIMNK